VKPWLARYTSDGAHVWSRTFGIEGGNASSIPTSVVRADGTILVTTDQSGDNSFPSDTMLRAFDMSGTELWTAASFDDGIVHGVAVAPSGAVLVAGFAGGQEPATFGYSTLEAGMALVAHDPAGIPIEGRTYDGTSVSQDVVTAVATSPLGATAIAGSWERTIDMNRRARERGQARHRHRRLQPAGRLGRKLDSARCEEKLAVMETNKVQAAERDSDRLTWAEICERFPDEWVVITGADWVNDTDFEFGTALVLGHFKRRKDASPHIKLWFQSYDDIGSFWTGPIRAAPLQLRGL
jgi:hypothetical protein